eukprot:389086_1
MISFKQKTNEAITAHFVSMEAAIIVNLILLLLLIRHFKRQPSQPTSLKILSLASILLSLLSPTMQCIVHSNSQFIDQCCFNMLRVSFTSLSVVSTFSVTMFLLCKLNIIGQGSSFKFYGYIAVCSAIAVVHACVLPTHYEAKIYIGSTDTDYKLCFVSPPATPMSVIGLIACSINMLLLYYVLYSKTKSAANDSDAPCVVPRYLKVIRRCCIGGVLSVFISSICMLCVILYDVIYLFGVTCAVTALPVICAFDIELNACQTMNDAVIEDQRQTEMDQRREEYLIAIMNEYYKVPTRIQSQGSFHHV